MILTKHKIQEEVSNGTIRISPFDPASLNPNSYNYRLGPTLKVARTRGDDSVSFEEIRIPREGYLLAPAKMYLASTFETIGSSVYAVSLVGRSSIGRLGLFVQCSANLGHTGAIHKWTLELVAAKPFLVYPLMTIGQVSFWVNSKRTDSYHGYYGSFDIPTESAHRQ